MAIYIEQTPAYKRGFMWTCHHFYDQWLIPWQASQKYDLHDIDQD